MKYGKILEGTFLERPNRFIAHISIQGKTEICHVKNTGRCKELLIPGTKVFVEKADQPSRKTGFDLIAVCKGDTLINVDSQAPNRVVEEWLRMENLLNDLTLLKREVTFGSSRFDLYGEYGHGKKAFLEVKGVTLEQDGAARFPDAPTERGIKHLEELIRCKEAGYEAYVIFVIQMKGIHRMEPNWKTHFRFGETLRKAAEAGVHVLAYDCKVEPDSLLLDAPVPVLLKKG